MRTLGVPYPDGYESVANEELQKQADKITAELKKNGLTADGRKEIIALIAYLQRLGTDIKVSTNSAIK